MDRTLEDIALTALEDELKCSVCHDLYREPQLLPCGHNFCLKCLQNLKGFSEYSFSPLQCPECRESHYNSKQWQRNFKLSSIADCFRRLKRVQRPSPSPPRPSDMTTKLPQVSEQASGSGPSFDDAHVGHCEPDRRTTAVFYAEPGETHIHHRNIVCDVLDEGYNVIDETSTEEDGSDEYEDEDENDGNNLTMMERYVSLFDSIERVASSSEEED